jgi:hypothetical protein
MMGWLFVESFQKLGSAICFSISSSWDFFAAESKIPPDPLHAGTEVGEAAVKFV